MRLLIVIILLSLAGCTWAGELPVSAGAGASQCSVPMSNSEWRDLREKANRLSGNEPAPRHLCSGELPDSQLTPGVSRNLTLEQICNTKWGKDARAVTAAMKRQVYAEYHMDRHQGECALSKRGCEVDHLISRELGGADDVRNLWPQPYGGQCNAIQKDRLENALHARVCHKPVAQMTIEQAQQAIRTDWVAAYNLYVGPLICPSGEQP